MAKKGYITRTRTWETKSGKTHTKTYYYEKKTTNGRTTKAGKKTKETYSRIDAVVNRKKTLTKDEVREYLESKSASLGDIQLILNETKDNPIRGTKGKQFTLTQLEALYNKVKTDKLSTMLRNLGYSMDEFQSEFNISETDLKAGNFERIGNNVRFTSKKGKVVLFSWDYDSGLTLKQ